MFVTVDTHQRFKYFISQTTSIRLELSSSNEKSCVSTVISKELTISSKLQVTMFSALWWPLDRLQASIALYSFSFEMKRRVIAKYLCICLLDTKSTVDTSSLDSLRFFYQYLWVISVAMLVIRVAERCFRLGLNYLIPLQKI